MTSLAACTSLRDFRKDKDWNCRTECCRSGVLIVSSPTASKSIATLVKFTSLGLSLEFDIDIPVDIDEILAQQLWWSPLWLKHLQTQDLG